MITHATTNEMHPLVGRHAMLPVKDMDVRVRILNVKTAFGATRVQVAPVSGSGDSWYELESVTLVDDIDSDKIMDVAAG
jgi:hypothetical protein